MKWRQIILSQPTSITFDDGVEAFISCDSKVMEGKRQGYAKLISAAGKETNLIDAVDDGQTTSAPNIFAITGERPQEVFLFGGPMAYRLDSALTIQGATQALQEKRIRGILDIKLCRNETWLSYYL